MKLELIFNAEKIRCMELRRNLWLFHENCFVCKTVLWTVLARNHLLPSLQVRDPRLWVVDGWCPPTGTHHCSTTQWKAPWWWEHSYWRALFSCGNQTSQPREERMPRSGVGNRIHMGKRTDIWRITFALLTHPLISLNCHNNQRRSFPPAFKIAEAPERLCLSYCWLKRDTAQAKPKPFFDSQMFAPTRLFP